MELLLYNGGRDRTLHIPQQKPKPRMLKRENAGNFVVERQQNLLVDRTSNTYSGDSSSNKKHLLVRSTDAMTRTSFLSPNNIQHKRERPPEFDPPRAEFRISKDRNQQQEIVLLSGALNKALSPGESKSSTNQHQSSRPTLHVSLSMQYQKAARQSLNSSPTKSMDPRKAFFHSVPLPDDQRVSTRNVKTSPLSSTKSMNSTMQYERRWDYSTEALITSYDNCCRSSHIYVPPHSSRALVTPAPKKLRLADPAVIATTALVQGPSPDSMTSLSSSPILLSSTISSLNVSSSSASLVSRKRNHHKTLGFLAESFCRTFSSKPKNSDVIIDAFAAKMGVERRRMNDVVNILESVQMVTKKKAKNTYRWMGWEHLPTLFATLQQKALKIYPEDATANGLFVVDDPAAAYVSHCRPVSTTKKDTRTLSGLSTLFLQVFLAGNTEMSLPDASDKIHGESTVQQRMAALGMRRSNATNPPIPPLVDEYDNDGRVLQQLDGDNKEEPMTRQQQVAAARGLLKTKIRRLYDIANVFCALGILTKLDNTGLRCSNDRPTFCWTFYVPVLQLPCMLNSKALSLPESIMKQREHEQHPAHMLPRKKTAASAPSR